MINISSSFLSLSSTVALGFIYCSFVGVPLCILNEDFFNPKKLCNNYQLRVKTIITAPAHVLNMYIITFSQESLC